MGIFYDFHEEEADAEYVAWFKANVTESTLILQAKALGKACRVTIIAEAEKHGLTEDAIKFPEIRVM